MVHGCMLLLLHIMCKSKPDPLGPDDGLCTPPGSLRRVSAMRGGCGAVYYGLTYRMGRHAPGLAAVVGDKACSGAGPRSPPSSHAACVARRRQQPGSRSNGHLPAGR